MQFNTAHIKLSKRDIERSLKLPKIMSIDLAEIIGIHFGDGSMQNYNYTHKIDYTSNIAEIQYIQHIGKLFKKVFNVNLQQYSDIKKNATVLYFNSKAICNFFNKKLQIPYSPKNNLQIPKILNKKEYKIAFLRGIFDTDGCITVQRQGKYRYTLIKICTKLKNLAQSIQHLLNQLDIPAFICTKNGRGFLVYDVVIRNKNTIKFFELIGSNNSKNIKKMGMQGFGPRSTGILP